MKWDFWERRREYLNGPPTKEVVDNAKKYFSDSISILGFLGGVTLAALVLLLEEQAAIEASTSQLYFEFLVWFLGMVSVICVVACSLAQRVVAGWVPIGSFSWHSAYWLHNIAYLTFLASLPLVLWPFAPYAALGVFAGGSIIGLVFVVIPFFRGDNLFTIRKR